MKKYLYVFLLISLFLSPLGIFAQEEESQEESSNLVTEIKELFSIVGEELEILFTFDPEKKIDKRIEFAQKRFEEMKALALENGDPDEMEIIQARYLRQIEQALQIAYKHTERQTERAEKITAQHEKHREVLEKVLEQVPEEAQPNITKVIDKIDTRYDERLLIEQSKSEKSNNKGGKGNQQEE